MTSHETPDESQLANPTKPETTTPSPARKPSRLGRKLGILLVVLLVVVAVAPTVISYTVLRSIVASNLAETLGTDVDIVEIRVGWMNGLFLKGLTIENPEGFPRDEPAIAINLSGDIGIVSLLSGKIDVSGKAPIVLVNVIQRADGTTNLEKLGVKSAVSGSSSSSSESSSDGIDLANIRLDLALEHARVTISNETTGLIEDVRDIEATVKKPFGTNDVAIEIGATFGSEAKPGQLDATVDVDAAFERPAEVAIKTTAIDLSRYAPILQSRMPGAVDAFEGIAHGEITARVDPTKEIVVGGEFVVDEPRIGGAMLGGMHARAPKWRIEPRIRADLAQSPPKVDTSGLVVDLGFVNVRGLDAAETAALGTGPGFGAEFSVDLAKVAEFGGAIPAGIDADGVRLDGRVALPAAAIDGGFDVTRVLAGVALDSTLTARRLVIEQRELTTFGLDAKCQGGKLTVDTRDGSRLDGGALSLTVRSDLTKLDSEPVAVAMQVDGASLSPSAAPALRFVIPFLAGFAPNSSHVDLRGSAKVGLQASGPALPSGDQTTLEWLNEWSGSGDVALSDGSFTPAEAFAKLLELTGQRTKLEFQNISTAFRLEAGKIASEALELSSKGKKLGLSGHTTLAGEIDYSFDIAALLADHKDGQKILEYVPADQLAAKLGGTLDAPRVLMPNVQELVQGALKKAVEAQAKKALEDKAGDLLRDILNR